ncbi:hypothetical protein LOTGIDRAFT_176106 [Lottia gigantea]|uniref:Uncharacterized protein n=1 Tax=Lottia gigantea TaxID=225164 RepID=V3ZQ34_LOTGI|nr:hypothetical protein LOTGIDRAFT_176106 [Lottia gigantea]ESO84615.1 hypothetical protein LOTGIDRAFT_176106 [Lottia gigantea]
MTEGEYPKAQSARPFRLEENEKFVKFFNEQEFRHRTAILKVGFKYPTNMFFQPIPAKDKITFTNRNTYLTKEFQDFINSFQKSNRKGVMTTARISKFNKKFNTNFQIYNPKDSHFQLKKVLEEFDWVFYLHKEHFCLIRRNNKAFTCSFKHQSTSLADWGNSSNLPINLRKITDINIAKFTKETWESLRPEWETYAKRDTLCLGACLIKYNQAMKKTVFQNVSNNLTAPSLSLKDTDSLYISSSNWNKLNEAGLVSENEYSKGKNDYGDGGIIFGLYLAPKLKYNIILTSEGVLKEIKTFKGYSIYKIKVEDYIQLASGHDVTNEFKKLWVKSFIDGIVIPNEKQKKVFRSYLNLVKRKAPNSEGIMYPYNNKDEMCLDDDYVFDDFDNFTNVSNDDPSE